MKEPVLVAGKTTPKAKIIVYWIVTALLCLQAMPMHDRGEASMGRPAWGGNIEYEQR